MFAGWQTAALKANRKPLLWPWPWGAWLRSGLGPGVPVGEGVWRVLEGVWRVWRVLVWKRFRGFGRFGGFWRVFGGFGKVLEGLEGLEGFGGCLEGLEDFGAFGGVLEGLEVFAGLANWQL